MFLGRKGRKMNDCKQCDKVLINWLGDLGCSTLKDWITREEYKEGKKILDNCPLKEQK